MQLKQMRLAFCFAGRSACLGYALQAHAAMTGSRPGAIAQAAIANAVALFHHTAPKAETKVAASLCATQRQLTASCQANVSPPHKGLMPAWPSGNSSGNVQASRFKVTVPVLRGRP